MTDRTWTWRIVAALAALAFVGGCVPSLETNPSRDPNLTLPAGLGGDAAPAGPSVATQQHWEGFFSDPHLRALIDAALKNNPELNIRLQETIIAQAEVGARRGEYLPRVNGGATLGVEKVGQTTSQGRSDEAHGVPENMLNLGFGLRASWEVDVWGRLRDAARAADHRYLASVEARNFIITEVVAEIARSYWDLVALDRRLEIIALNIELQKSVLELVVAKKAAARGTELEVQRFQAEVLENQSRVFELERQRVVVENRINFLLGRFPQKVARGEAAFFVDPPNIVATGVPSELLDNRPDVRAAVNQLAAARIDTQVAKARFYPSLSIEAGVGFESFNAMHLLQTPESLAYNAVGNLVAPLVNRAGIEADYRAANARQIQAVFAFERAVLGAFADVANELAALDNLGRRYERIKAQVATLEQAVATAIVLYQAARADYLDVLLTRRDLIGAQIELIETRKGQLQALADVYKALGGGWKTKEVPKGPSAEGPANTPAEPPKAVKGGAP
jgi:multidrug efflux system outer membrane protein